MPPDAQLLRVTHYLTDEPPGQPATRPVGLLPIWFFLAALSQLLYLAHWPLYLGGRWIPFLPALAVAFTRMGLYAALGGGLLRRDRVAWAGSVLEIVRTVLLFLLAVIFHGGSLMGALFPAWWAQGLLSAVLPLQLGLLTAVDWGWRPGSGLEVNILLGARLLVAGSVLSALSLRRRGVDFGAGPNAGWRVLFGSGLPLVLVLTAVEAAAWLLAGRG